MSQIETLGILEEIQALVSDKLQVVSYKWLSRNFLVSSNVAKRLLAEFVEKHGNGFEVVYSLSGWLKNTPSSYHIQLVTGPKLAEAKQEYDDNCRVHVYSVQASIPKDPPGLWSAEFIQAEELFKQPATVDNCLRDNRSVPHFCKVVIVAQFGGISASFINRTLDGKPVTVAAAQPNSLSISGLSNHNSAQNNAALQTQQNKVQQSSSEVAQRPASVVKDTKSESNSKGVHDLSSKPSADKEKFSSFPLNNKKSQNDKSSHGSGGSLANLWGRASTKPKASGVPADNSDSIHSHNVSADAQISAREAVRDENSDDDAQDVNFRRASNGEGNRKRRVVFDFSDEDEYEDAVNLASPDPPKKKPFLDSEQNAKTLATKMPDLTEEKPNKDEVKVKEERTTDREPNISLVKEISLVSKSTNGRHSSLVKVENQLPDADLSKKDKVTDAAPNSPKRKKVMKTRIDDRGREVIEVVWEGEETEVKKVENDVPKKVGTGVAAKADNNSVTNTNNRPAAAKKSPAVGNTAPANPGGKAGNKKGGNAKDPKQGNILSFFRRV
ncbi:DNA polymerase subunit Cdc27 [Corchorus olitorius]|uniref:DNA polymerase delta subunit 3 n=1 Tax=Corchorus olitorius TaxID=93759 RepID=A0A1R3JCH2_9ROSI|nr:DNA polymerase subunit Cdc27 [Corchorus olitorius]